MISPEYYPKLKFWIGGESRKFMVFGLCPDPHGEWGVASLWCGGCRVKGVLVENMRRYWSVIRLPLNLALVPIVSSCAE